MIAALFSTFACIAAEAAAHQSAGPAKAQPSAPKAIAAVVAAAPKEAAKPTVAFAALPDASVVKEVETYLASLTTMRGRFVQTGPTGAVAKGDFALRRPGQIRFDYDNPSPLTIVATQGSVYVENKDLEQTDTYPLGKTPLKFLLSKKVDLSDAKLLGVERAAGAVTLIYGSKDEDQGGDIAIRFAAPALAIQGWEVRDPQNGVTLVELASVETGVKLDNRLFVAPDAGGRFINR
jgi:outer membrane lipoprotein-sorting protein